MSEDASVVTPAQFVPAAPVAQTRMTNLPDDSRAAPVLHAVENGVDASPTLRDAGLYVAAERAIANQQVAAGIAAETYTMSNARPAVPAGPAGEAVLESAVAANKTQAGLRAGFMPALTAEATSTLVAQTYESIAKVRVAAQPAVTPATAPQPAAENNFSGALSLDALVAAPQQPSHSFAALQADFATAGIPNLADGTALYDSGKIPATTFLQGLKISKFDMLAGSMETAAIDARFIEVGDPQEGNAISKVASGKSPGLNPPVAVPVVAVGYSPFVDAETQMAMAARRAKHAQMQPRGPQSYAPSGTR